MRFGIRTMSYRLEGVDESTERLGRSCIWIVWWEDRTQVISILSRDNPLHRQDWLTDWLTDMHKLKKVEFKSTRYLGRYTFPTFINLFLSFPISFSPLSLPPFLFHSPFASLFPSFSFYKWAILGLFLVNFRSFQANNAIFTTN